MRNLCFVCCLLSSHLAFSQEYHFGIHLNPSFTIPAISKTYYNKSIRTDRLKLNFNTGLNFAVSYQRFDIESALNFAQRSVNFHQTFLDNSTGSISSYSINIHNDILEIPLIVEYNIIPKNKNRKIFLQAGGSIEFNEGGSTTYETRTAANSSLSIYPYYYAYTYKQVLIDAIIGFKMNETIKKLGLFEYGITYHYPLTYGAPYLISAIVTPDNKTGYNYSGNFYTHLSCIDFKLCYYFVNLNSRGKALKYKNLNKIQ